MAKNPQPAAVQTLLDLIDEAFDHPAWHGPNLKSSLRGVTAEMAARAPGKGRHSIREIIIHAAYWKHQVQRRLLQTKPASFPVRGRNWFPVASDWNENSWKSLLLLLENEHKGLRQAVAGLKPRQLTEAAGRAGQTVTDNVIGIAFHDVYHAGQIQLLKRLMQGSKHRPMED